jgi:trehalose 6-phosphate phosphatase
MPQREPSPESRSEPQSESQPEPVTVPGLAPGSPSGPSRGSSRGPSPGALPRPRSAAGVAGLAALLAAPRRALLSFDFDGTLAPIVEDPRDARAHPDIGPAVRRLAPLVGAFAVVTGRPAAIAVDYSGLGDVPGLVVLGQYGLERWEGGVLHVPDPPPGVDEARRRLPDVLTAADAPAETWVEDKGHALAVHTRRTPAPAAVFDRLRGPLSTLAGEAGLIVEPGRFVLELRPPGVDKGAALRGLVAERVPGAVLYAGDDLGDLAAYDAVEQLRAGGPPGRPAPAATSPDSPDSPDSAGSGRAGGPDEPGGSDGAGECGVPGLTVCSASTEEPLLASRADIVVDGPAGVANLLVALAAELGG